MLELNQLYRMDCMEGMKQFPDKYFDMCLTSPPFKDEDVQGDYWKIYDVWIKEIFRITGKVILIIHSATKINEHVLKYPSKRILIWNKGIIKYSYRFNPIYAYQIDDNYKINKKIYSDTNTQQPVRNRSHPYEDPIKIYQWLISMFNDCNTIIDPFMGSGTTAIACEMENRKWIGFETFLDNYTTAIKRIETYKLRPKPFINLSKLKSFIDENNQG